MTTFNFRGLPDCFVRMIRFFVVYIYLIREIFYFRNDGLSLAYQKRNKKIVKVEGRASVIVELTQFNFRSLDSLRSNKSRMTAPPLTRKISQKYVTEALSTPVIKKSEKITTKLFSPVTTVSHIPGLVR